MRIQVQKATIEKVLDHVRIRGWVDDDRLGHGNADLSVPSLYEFLLVFAYFDAHGGRPDEGSEEGFPDERRYIAFEGRRFLWRLVDEIDSIRQLIDINQIGEGGRLASRVPAAFQTGKGRRLAIR